jgi:hypothetical protein
MWIIFQEQYVLVQDRGHLPTEQQVNLAFHILVTGIVLYTFSNIIYGYQNVL